MPALLAFYFRCATIPHKVHLTCCSTSHICTEPLPSCSKLLIVLQRASVMVSELVLVSAIAYASRSAPPSCSFRKIAYADYLHSGLDVTTAYAASMQA